MRGMARGPRAAEDSSSTLGPALSAAQTAGGGGGGGGLAPCGWKTMRSGHGSAFLQISPR